MSMTRRSFIGKIGAALAVAFAAPQALVSGQTAITKTVAQTVAHESDPGRTLATMLWDEIEKRGLVIIDAETINLYGGFAIGIRTRIKGYSDHNTLLASCVVEKDERLWAIDKQTFATKTADGFKAAYDAHMAACAAELSQP